MLWLTEEIRFVEDDQRDLVLPIGYRLDAFDALRKQSKFSIADIRAAKAAGVNVYGSNAFISEVFGLLRAFSRSQVTNVRPQLEAEPYFKRKGHHDAAILQSDARNPEEHAASGGQDVGPVGAGLPHEGGTDAVRVDGYEQMPGTPPADQALSSTVDDSTCGVVAIIDFMNLFMRAWHAGQPSDVHAVRSMFDTVGNLIDTVCPDFLVFALDGGSDHRRKLYPQYKDRPAKPPEVLAQIKLAEQALHVLGWPAIRVIGWEADDVIASLAAQLESKASGIVLVSADKDILQVCAGSRARVYHPWGTGEHFTEELCLKKFGVTFDKMNAYLSLRGDSTDGVPGVPGVGEKTAAELLNTHGTFERVLTAAAAGQVKGKVGQSLVEHAEVARLSRKLVTLRADLPVGDHWLEWPIDQPRLDWREGLKRLKLFPSAQRLQRRLPTGVDHGSKPSQVDIEWFAIGFDQVAKEFISAEIPPQVVPAPSTAAMPPGDDVESWRPGLYACPLDASLLDKVRAVYRTGLDHFQNNRQVENSWKRESAYFAAFDDGISGRELSVDLADYDTDGKRSSNTMRPATPPVAMEASPARAGALF